MFHVSGWGHIYAITGMGATHVCSRGVDAEWIFDTVAAEDVSYLCGAPTVLNRLVEHYENENPATTGANDVRIATAGSAPPGDHSHGRSGVRLVPQNVYGATETGPAHHDLRRPAPLRRRQRRPVRDQETTGPGLPRHGRPASSTGRRGRPRDDATIGEVVVRGNQVMEGTGTSRRRPKRRSPPVSRVLPHWRPRHGRRARDDRHPGPEEGHHHLRRREHLVDRTGGRAVRPRGRLRRRCRPRPERRVGQRRPRRSSSPRRTSTTRTPSKRTWSSTRARHSASYKAVRASRSSRRSRRRRRARFRSTNSAPAYVGGRGPNGRRGIAGFAGGARLLLAVEPWAVFELPSHEGYRRGE